MFKVRELVEGVDSEVSDRHLPLAFVTNSALRTLLYQVSPFDISIFLVVTVVLAGVGLLASYLPAVRATRGDPLIALTHNT